MIRRLRAWWRDRRHAKARALVGADLRTEFAAEVYTEVSRAHYRDLVNTHGPGVWACLNGDAALFLGTASERSLSHLRKEAA